MMFESLAGMFSGAQPMDTGAGMSPMGDYGSSGFAPPTDQAPMGAGMFNKLFEYIQGLEPQQQAKEIDILGKLFKSGIALKDGIGKSQSMQRLFQEMQQQRPSGPPQGISVPNVMDVINMEKAKMGL